jgi:hypothetical protein
LLQVVYSKNPAPFIVVSGDMNDGAGMDMFEEKYLLGDSVGMPDLGGLVAAFWVLKGMYLRHSVVASLFGGLFI